MGKQLQKLRSRFTPRRRLWTGVSLLAVVFFSAMDALEANLSVLIAPAATFLMSTVLPAAS